MFNKFIKLVFASLLFFSVSSTTFAMEKLHFLIGGGAGGGWDGTARGTGEALIKAGFLAVSYTHLTLPTNREV